MKTILYVDDEKANRLVFESMFENDFVIASEGSGKDALRYMEEHEVAVIVSDQRMPGLNGNELLRIVRQRWPQTVRIIVTAFKDVDAILRGVNDGLVARYVVKPWDEQELRQILRWGLEAYDLALQNYGGAMQARLLESEKLATLGAMQTSFLHELGTPLAYITGSVDELAHLESHKASLLELLDRDKERRPEEWQALRSFLEGFSETFENLRTGTRVLSYLREDVQRLVQNSDQRLPDVSSAYEVQRAIEFAIAVNKRDAILAHSNLRFELPEGVPTLAISPDNLMLVMINLTRNAIQAQSPGEHGNEVVIKIETDRDRNLARVLVHDNGSGMTEEVSRRIGQQFYTTRDEGTGLGVYRCRSVLSRVGGGLSFDTTAGGGTTAIATIPCKEGDKA